MATLYHKKPVSKYQIPMTYCLNWRMLTQWHYINHFQTTIITRSMHLTDYPSMYIHWQYVLREKSRMFFHWDEANLNNRTPEKICHCWHQENQNDENGFQNTVKETKPSWRLSNNLRNIEYYPKCSTCLEVLHKLYDLVDHLN